MNKKTVIEILEKQKYIIRYEDGNIVGIPYPKSIAIEFIFHEKIGKERPLKEIIICTPVGKTERARLGEELHSQFGTPIYDHKLKLIESKN